MLIKVWFNSEFKSEIRVNFGESIYFNGKSNENCQYQRWVERIKFEGCT